MFPVTEVIPDIRQALARHRQAVLQAPPGAGKTTVVPLALLDSDWLDGRRIVMLEPRRVAARAAAHRMAQMHGEQVGNTVGFRTRTETRVSAATKIEVVTEGVLTRRIQNDPTLGDVGLVIFDEFHERSLVGDLGLALTLHSMSLVREDLRILIMSATLDADAIATVLGGAPVITASGRMHPVETIYLPPRDPLAVDAAVASCIRKALASDQGDVLAFLPGAPEIRRVAAMLGDVNGVDILALHGTMSATEQDRAISPASRRRVVLSTAIAETSVTIPGVRVVVDCGLARRPRFSAAAGMTRLETMRVSRATADQRRGRAGRTASGVCYRLWNEHDELAPSAVPEILEADLAPLALELAAAGIHDAETLTWIDSPPKGSLAAARELLLHLGLVDSEGLPTEEGRLAARLPVHPRLAHMILRAGRGARRDACDIAAMLSERDFIRFESASDPDVRLRMDLLGAVRSNRGISAPAGSWIDRQAVARILRESARLHDAVASVTTLAVTDDADDPGALVALAFPDRVARVRTSQRGRYVSRRGSEFTVDSASPLAGEEFIAAAELDGRKPVSRVFMAASLDRETVERLFADDIVTTRSVVWDDSVEAVRSIEQRRLGAIILEERQVRAAPEDVSVALMHAAIARGLLADEEFLAEVARIAFARSIDAGLPEITAENLAGSAGDWLLPAMTGLRTLAAASRVDLRAALSGTFDYAQRRRIDELAPTHFAAPTGSRAPVDYADPTAPAISVKIQELFGVRETPRVGGGRVPLTIRLLSPARRPVQVTRDLAGFWKSSYFDVRKDLRGRYPRHPWPDDPASATPTRRATPRS